MTHNDDSNDGGIPSTEIQLPHLGAVLTVVDDVIHATISGIIRFAAGVAEGYTAETFRPQCCDRGW